MNTPLFDPFAGTARGRDHVWGGQHACLTPGWRQSRHRAAYWLCGGRGKPSDWPHTTGNPAHGVRERDTVGRERQRISTRARSVTNPWAGFPVVCGQSDGSPRPPHNQYAALRRDCREAGVKHACCPPYSWARRSRCARKRIEKGHIHPPTRQGSLARTPDLTSEPYSHVRVGP